MASKIRKNDEVVITTGKYKDMSNPRKVLAVFPERNKILVDGVTVKKHVRANPNINEEGGIKEKPCPIDMSNVAIYNPIKGGADRVGFKTLDGGKKVRIYRSNNEQIDNV